MTPQDAESWIRVVSKAAVTVSFLGIGSWLVITQQVDWGYSFLTFVAGYWLK